MNTNINNDSNNIEEVYQKFWTLAGEMLENHAPEAIAGVMVAQALTIYKTVLPPEDFNLIVDAISESRDRIKRLEEPVLQ